VGELRNVVGYFMDRSALSLSKKKKDPRSLFYHGHICYCTCCHPVITVIHMHLGVQYRHAPANGFGEFCLSLITIYIYLVPSISGFIQCTRSTITGAAVLVQVDQIQMRCPFFFLYKDIGAKCRLIHYIFYTRR